MAANNGTNPTMAGTTLPPPAKSGPRSLLWPWGAVAAGAMVLSVACCGTGIVVGMMFAGRSESPVSKDGGIVTMKIFNAIQRGMTYGDVVQIIDREGKEVAKTDVFQNFIWVNPDGSNLTCKFWSHHGITELDTKEHKGLK